jgi:hypothetical protein
LAPFEKETNSDHCLLTVDAKKPRLDFYVFQAAMMASTNESDLRLVASLSCGTPPGLTSRSDDANFLPASPNCHMRLVGMKVDENCCTLCFP